MSMHVGPVIMNTNILIGAAGAVTSFIGTLTSSVTRVSTGIYKINLADTYNASLFTAGSMQSPGSGLSTIMAVEIQNAPSTSVSTFSTPSITVKTLDVTGALADPASGSTLSVLALLNNSSVKA